MSQRLLGSSLMSLLKDPSEWADPTHTQRENLCVRFFSLRCLRLWSGFSSDAEVPPPGDISCRWRDGGRGRWVGEGPMLSSEKHPHCDVKKKSHVSGDNLHRLCVTQSQPTITHTNTHIVLPQQPSSPLNVPPSWNSPAPRPLALGGDTLTIHRNLQHEIMWCFVIYFFSFFFFFKIYISVRPVGTGRPWTVKCILSSPTQTSVRDAAAMMRLR